MDLSLDLVELLVIETFRSLEMVVTRQPPVKESRLSMDELHHHYGTSCRNVEWCHCSRYIVR